MFSHTTNNLKYWSDSLGYACIHYMQLWTLTKVWEYYIVTPLQRGTAQVSSKTVEFCKWMTCEWKNISEKRWEMYLSYWFSVYLQSFSNCTCTQDGNEILSYPQCSPSCNMTLLVYLIACSQEEVSTVISFIFLYESTDLWKRVETCCCGLHESGARLSDPLQVRASIHLTRGVIHLFSYTKWVGSIFPSGPHISL